MSVWSFFLREPSRRSDHQLTKEDKEELKRWSHAYIQKYDYHPSGCLTLEIDGYWTHGVKSRWTDGKKKRLENQLHEFVCNVIKIADLKRTRRIEREKQEREWELERQRQAELARLRQIELERREDLEKQAENWVKSRQLREYIQAVEIAASKQGISGPSHEGYAFWIPALRSAAAGMTNLVVGLITSLSICNNAMDDVTRFTFNNRFIIRVKFQRNGFNFIFFRQDLQD